MQVVHNAVDEIAQAHLTVNSISQTDISIPIWEDSEPSPSFRLVSIGVTYSQRMDLLRDHIDARIGRFLCDMKEAGLQPSVAMNISYMDGHDRFCIPSEAMQSLECSNPDSIDVREFLTSREACQLVTGFQ